MYSKLKEQLEEIYTTINRDFNEDSAEVQNLLELVRSTWDTVIQLEDEEEITEVEFEEGLE
jgi:hypothetical protein